MERKEILDELKNFKIVPHSDIEINKMTDKHLELRLNLFKTMSEEADRNLAKNMEKL